MNKTQSIIFVIAVLAVTMAGNWLYLNRPKEGARVTKLVLKACSDDDNLYEYIHGRPMELVYHHDTLFLQFYYGDAKNESSDKIIYHFIKQY